MRLGILSDTHNHLPETRRALDLLLRRGAGHLIHCGDAGEEVMDLLSATCLEHGHRAHVPIGNSDHIPAPRLAPAPAGIERATAPELEFDGRRCLVLHGHDARRLHQAVASGRFDFILTGHTHRPQDEQAGPTRILNPGSCARPRLGPPTVLLLDLPAGNALWLPVPG
jgi:putative phosphoesterase